MLCRCVIHSRIFEARASFEPPEVTYRTKQCYKFEEKKRVLRMKVAFTFSFTGHIIVTLY
jgi:hypothetical protein